MQNSVGYKVNTQMVEGLYNKGCVLMLFFRTIATKAAKQELFQTTWVLIRSCCVFNANAQWGKQWRGESKASLLGNHHLLNSDCLVQVYPEHNWQWVAWQHCAIFCKVSPLSWLLNTWWMSSKAREQSKPFCLGLMLDLGPYAGNLIPTPKALAIPSL